MSEVERVAPSAGRGSVYRQNQERLAGSLEVLERRSALASNLRGLAFAAFFVFALLALLGRAAPLAVPVTLMALAVFGVLVVWHGRIIKNEEATRRLHRVNGDALARVNEAWRSLPENGERFRSASHPYSEDLDVFGTGSLFQRLCVAHTRYGQERLAKYLSEPAPPELVKARQEAVAMLSTKLAERQALEAESLAVVERPGAGASGRSALKEPPDPEAFLRWAEEEPALSRSWFVRSGARVFPGLLLLAFLLSALNLAPAWLLILPLAGNAAVLIAVRGVTHEVFSAVSATQGAFLRYGTMLELLEGLHIDAKLVSDLKERLLSGSSRPSLAMKDFRNKVGWFDLRHNGLIHPFAAILLLWDVNCVLALESWQKASGRGVRGWFEALGELEALSSLAGLKYDEPGFSFPELSAEGALFVARGLSHPLIDHKKRVDNEVSLDGAGRALLVTGSNMSGKSTLLRSMGLASVLCFAGAPVAAQSLRIAPCRLCTSIRISDSLEGGVSHFYAELSKLKQVVESTRGELPVFFLLDEILHGTNSRERQVGARWVLAELLQSGAVGVVTTHDMELCRLPEPLMTRVTQVHFRESVTDERMTFDYKLRQGPVSAGNALTLMRLMGLNVPLE